LHDTNLHKSKADSFLLVARSLGVDFVVFLETHTTAVDNPLQGFRGSIFEDVANKQVFKGFPWYRCGRG